jgi:molybdopterin synthase sulfur carrier subunit
LQISVRYFTVLREVTNKREETIEFSENEKATVESVLNKLSIKYGPPFSEYVYDEKTREVKRFLQFFINGKSASAVRGKSSDLKDGEVLAIVPPVGGG